MSRCFFPKCKDEATGAKQFNPDFVRIYVCTKHMIQIAEIFRWEDFKKII